MDIKLSNGQEITFDLNKITRREFMAVIDRDNSDEETDALIGKTCDMTAENVANLGYEDWRRFMQAFWKKAARPLDDPNA